MKFKILHILSLFLIFCLVCSLFSGCGFRYFQTSLPESSTHEMQQNSSSLLSSESDSEDTSEADTSQEHSADSSGGSSQQSSSDTEGGAPAGGENTAIGEAESEPLSESSQSSSEESSQLQQSQTETSQSESSAESSAGAQQGSQSSQSSAPTNSDTESSSAASTSPLDSAPHAALYNAQTLESVYLKASAQPIAPASLTKLVTALTALKYVSPDTVFTVGTEQNLVQPGSSICLIRQGHRLKLRDLITGMLLASGNDAAYTVAVNVARTVSGNPNMGDREAVTYFAGLMNQFVKSIGAQNSCFVNPEGWDHPDQHTTVEDLAKIAKAAISNPTIREIASWHQKYVVFASGENVTWVNSNSLLDPQSPYYMSNASGLKTGTTQNAGRCLIAVVEKNGTQYIAIVAGCRTEDARYFSIRELMKMA